MQVSKWQYGEFRLPSSVYDSASIAPRLREGWELIGIRVRGTKKPTNWAVMRRWIG